MISLWWLGQIEPVRNLPATGQPFSGLANFVDLGRFEVVRAVEANGDVQTDGHHSGVQHWGRALRNDAGQGCTLWMAPVMNKGMLMPLVLMNRICNPGI